MENKTFTYALVLNGASNQVNLNQPLSKIKTFKVLNARYTTSASDNVACLLSIPGFNNKKFIYGTSTNNYTKFLLLPDSNQSITTFTNLTGEYDSVFQEHQLFYASNITIDLIFYKKTGTLTYASSEITSSNPFLLEFEIICY